MGNEFRLKFTKVFLFLNGFLLFFWWPLSHWFYSDFYHHLVGFGPGNYHTAFIRVIGICGVMPVMLSLMAAKDPVRNRAAIITLITFGYLLAAGFTYLIAIGGLPKREFVNVGFSLLSALVLTIVYPRQSRPK